MENFFSFQKLGYEVSLTLFFPRPDIRQVYVASLHSPYSKLGKRMSSTTLMVWRCLYSKWPASKPIIVPIFFLPNCRSSSALAVDEPSMNLWDYSSPGKVLLVPNLLVSRLVLYRILDTSIGNAHSSFAKRSAFSFPVLSWRQLQSN